MESVGHLCLHLRSQSLITDEQRHYGWAVTSTTRDTACQAAAIVICDMWDAHWSRGAAERVDVMAPRMNAVVSAARNRGVQIIHAPSDTMPFYAGAPARRRMADVVQLAPPPIQPHDDPPQPVDSSDGGSDTGETTFSRPWTRQHPAIEIDQARDGVSDNGLEILSFLRQRGIGQILIMGVHTNMCVLNRSFAIKAMTRWGMPIALVRDLTDAMYNPARPPYVSHAEGTRLIIEYIEKFWCPTVESSDLLGNHP